MLMNFLLGIPTIIASLVVQLMLLLVALRYYRLHHHMMNTKAWWPAGVVIGAVMLMLLIGNLMQVAIWALLFMLVGEFEAYNSAFYHSLVNFASLGYGDIVMSEEYRLLGALEALNGVLMVGISAATLMSFFQDAFKRVFSTRNGDLSQ
ncbi:MAG: ion channel [Gammaproteobacteria bacterium]|jgi:voltage-gated potassium channel Kch